MKYSLLKLSAVSAAIMNPAQAAFHKDALVTTPDGNIPMSQLEVGQRVRSFSPKTEAMGSAIVMAKSLGEQSKSIVEIDLGERTIKAMPNQRLFDIGNQNWVRAKDLTTNNILLGEDGSQINIMKVQKKRRNSFSLPHEVSVDKEHNLFVNGVLCHNVWWEIFGTVGAGALRVAEVAGGILTAMEVNERTAPIREMRADARAVRRQSREGQVPLAEQQRRARQQERTLRDAGVQIMHQHLVAPVIEVAPAAAQPVINQAQANVDKLHDSLRREVTPNSNRDSGPIPTRLPNYNPHGRGVGWKEMPGPGYVEPSAAHLRAHDIVSAECEKSGVMPSQEEFERRIHNAKESFNSSSHQQDKVVYGFLSGGSNSAHNSIDNHARDAFLSPTPAPFSAKKEVVIAPRVDVAQKEEDRASMLHASEQSDKSLSARLLGIKRDKDRKIAQQEAESLSRPAAAPRPVDITPIIRQHEHAASKHVPTPEILALPAPTAVATFTKSHMDASENKRQQLIHRAEREARFNMSMNAEQSMKVVNVRKDMEANEKAQGIVRRAPRRR